jgi:hypothetical protein
LFIHICTINVFDSNLEGSTVTIHGLSGNKRKRIYENQRLSIVRQKIHNLSYFWPDFDFNKSTNRIGGVNPIMMRLIISTGKAPLEFIRSMRLKKAAQLLAKVE